MTEVKHPNGSVLRVSDDSVDMYLAEGWTKVEPDKQAKKPAPKK